MQVLRCKQQNTSAQPHENGNARPGPQCDGPPSAPGGAIMKKTKTRSVQYALRWRPVGNRWRLVGNRWRLVGNRWRLVGNRWRLVGSHQTSESGCHSKKKKGERPYGTPCSTHEPPPPSSATKIFAERLMAQCAVSVLKEDAPSFSHKQSFGRVREYFLQIHATSSHARILHLRWGCAPPNRQTMLRTGCDCEFGSTVLCRCGLEPRKGGARRCR